MMKKLTLSLMLLGVAVASSFAQMPEVPAEMKSIAWYAGTWSGKAKWNLPGMPAEESEMSFTNVMEGMFMKSVTTMKMGGMEFKETGYVGWDPKKKKYSSHTFTSWLPTPRVEWGTLNGDTLLFVSEPWESGMPTGATVSRATMTKKSDTSITFVLEFKEGEKWSKVAEGSFAKTTSKTR